MTELGKFIKMWENELGEMSLNPKFSFVQMKNIPPKFKEMYSEVYYDMICPFFFAVIRRLAYPMEGEGEYQATYDLKPRTYKVEDYRLTGIYEGYGGVMKKCSSFEEAEKFLLDNIPNYFEFKFDGGVPSENYTLVPKEVK